MCTSIYILNLFFSFDRKILEITSLYIARPNVKTYILYEPTNNPEIVLTFC